MDRAATALRLLAAVLLPVAVVLSHRNVTIILVLIGLAGLGSLRGLRWRSLPPWSRWAMALAGWAALSCAWAPLSIADGWPVYMALFVVLTASSVLCRDDRGTRAMLVSVAVCGALLLFEAATGGLIRDVVPPEGRADKDDVATARGMTIVISLLPGLFLGLWRQADASSRPGGLLVAGAVLIVLFGLATLPFGIAGNTLAVAAGTAAALLAAVIPRTTVRLGFLAAALPFILMPVLAALLPPVDVMADWTAGPASWRQRLIAWQAVWAATAEGGDAARFLAGHGVEGARALGRALGLLSVPGALGPVDVVPTHPHNVYLQVWYDLGLAGVILCLAALWHGARSLDRAAMPREVQMAIAAFLAVQIIAGLTDTSLWTAWRVAAPILGGWFIVQAARLAPERRV